jgi:hypothetical protein
MQVALLLGDESSGTRTPMGGSLHTQQRIFLEES